MNADEVMVDYINDSKDVYTRYCRGCGVELADYGYVSRHSVETCLSNLHERIQRLEALLVEQEQPK